MRFFRFKAVAVLVGIWVIAGAVIYFARGARPTPVSVESFAAQHPLEGKPPEERGSVLEKLARQLNQLDYDQRREVRMSRRLDALFKTCTPEEQSRFLDLTLPAGFKQMMEAFNKMPPAKRKMMIDHALVDLRKHGEDAAPPPDDPNLQKIVEQGLRSFYTDASAETKLDLAPVIEQIQKNLQGLR